MDALTRPGDTILGTDLAIEAIDVHKSFRGASVLRGVSLAVKPAETVCIIGASGSGKSTLLRCLNGLERPTTGRVLVGGVDITAPTSDIDEVRGGIGMVFQHFNLFPHMSAEANVALALRRVKKLPKDKAMALARVQLAGVGLAASAKLRPGQLSGGQQQRAAIARALALEPRTMLFDEPTSALDPELVKGILDIIQGLCTEGMTVVVVTHEMGFARQVADRVVFIDEGRIVEEGPPQEVLTAPHSARLKSFLSQVL